MTELSRDEQLEALHHQLHHWQDNLAARVTNEAQALDLELERLHDHEIDEVWEALRTGHAHVLAGCDALRDLRRRLQDRPGTHSQSHPPLRRL